MQLSKKKNSRVIYSLALLVLGFLFAFSYHLTKTENQTERVTNTEWERTLELRNELIDMEEKNILLQQELFDKQERITEIEHELAQDESVFYSLAEEAEKHRMFLGKVKVEGNGIEVTLTDGECNPLEDNVNNYIVHEHHLFAVINELKISGASAIAVNGQRITKNSYLICDGPVITVDGIQHPAPFKISAIGNADVLYAALNLAGGVKDQLVNENILFTLEKKNGLIFNPVIGS